MAQRPMSSKERVLTALARQEPDRVPIDYSANPGIDLRLKENFGLDSSDGEGLLQALGVDFRGVWIPYKGPRLHPELPDRCVDPLWGWRTCLVEHASGSYWDYCDFPLQDADEDLVARWPMPSPDDYDYSGIADACAAKGQFGVYIGDPGLACIINTSGFLRGMEQALVDLVTDDPAGLLLVDRMLAVQLEVTRRALEASKGGYDFMWIGEDLGSQIGPLISPEAFVRHIKPRHQPFFELAKAYDLPVMMHTCGSSSWAYDAYIEMGLKAVDTLQPEAVNMSPGYLKNRFGDRLAFHGCISTAGPVAYGTVDDTVDYCRRTLDTMMPGGGYCFSPTHSLQDNSPTENVVAMYETVHRHGWY